MELHELKDEISELSKEYMSLSDDVRSASSTPMKAQK